MKKLLIRVFLTIVLSIGLITSSISIANAETVSNTEAVSTVPKVPDYPCESIEDTDNMYPNPQDPKSFYQCGFNGELLLMKCPAELVFDVQANRCEWNPYPKQDSQ